MDWIKLEDMRYFQPLRDGSTLEDAKNIADWIQLLRDNSIRTPFIHGVTEDKGRPGLIFDMPRGKTIAEWMEISPNLWQKFISLLAHELYEVSKHQFTMLPSVKSRIEGRITGCDKIPSDLKAKVLARLKAMPDGDYVLNWNYVPQLIVLVNEEPTPIRWDELAKGPQLADAARTTVLMRLANDSVFSENFMLEYVKILNCSEDEVKAWIAIAAADKMADEDPDETDRLLSMLKRNLR